ncbi:hypothetical protein [uncultured Methanolobus sp.]|nr:hypothetical protein [uncultured Methanolobus sp.]
MNPDACILSNPSGIALEVDGLQTKNFLTGKSGLSVKCEAAHPVED